jgi:gliding motility-associated-like protein
MLTICENESLNVNGTEYNISNPSGTEVIMGSSQFGCDSTVNIDLSFLPTYNINTSSMLCEGDSIFLAGAWQFDAGSYVDNFMTAEMCDSVVTTVVTLMSCEFIVNSSTTDNPCADGASGSFTLEIGSTFTPPIQIEWTGTTGTSGSTSITTENSVTIDNLVSDDYTVRILDSNNDVLWEETVSIIDLNPAINGAWSVVDSILCVGEEGTIEFTATGGQSPYNYDWSPSSIGNSSIASNVNAGDYFLTITDDNGCTLETSFTLIDPVGFTASTSTIDLSCLDSNDGQISIVNITGGQAPYIININNQPADSTTITGLSAGQYTIEVIDANNCRIGFTEELVAGNNPDFAVYTEDYTIEQGASVIIEGTIESGNFTFEWTDNDGTLNCTDCAFPTANPIVTTSYDLIITDESGCTQSLSVTVNVEIVEVVDAVPNVFSPNGDNNNDDFKFTSTNLLTIGIELRIYDRWGNKVHNAQIIGNEVIWDGTKAGRELDSGVYIYQMILQNSDGTSEVKFGDVLLLR